MHTRVLKLLFISFLFTSYSLSYEIQDVKNITVIGKVHNIKAFDKYKIITINTKYNDKIKINTSDDISDIKKDEIIIATCIKNQYLKYKFCSIEKSIKNKKELWKRFL